jgi:hypothetical protein
MAWGDLMAAMTIGFVILVSLLMIGMGICGLVSPGVLLGLVSIWRSRAGLWAAGLLRVVFGAALWSAAPSSYTPATRHVMGAASFLAGLALPQIGPVRFEKLIDWWLRQPPALMRAWCLAAAALGVFLLWSISK